MQHGCSRIHPWNASSLSFANLRFDLSAFLARIGFVALGGGVYRGMGVVERFRGFLRFMPRP
jgi:hypothetical protein